jgi:large subunit ribosomal protein L3
MAIGLIGEKCGMTRFFGADGAMLPVTVIKVEPNRIVQIKDQAKDGYCAVQVTYGSSKVSKVNKAQLGHYAKAKTEAGKCLWEFRVAVNEVADYQIGTVFTVDMFKAGDMIDVQGTSKGKGFAGVIKRYHFAAQDATHGNSLSHRAPGSIGQRQTPGRVFPGKKMAGHMGDRTCTVLSQQILHIDLERNLILVKGGIPGADNSRVVIRPAVKARKAK